MAKKDLIRMGPEIEEGRHPYIRTHPNGDVSTGLIGAPCAEGAMMGDCLCLKHEEGPRFEVIHEHRASGPKGPPKVSTDEYRSGWDGIFGKKTVGEA